MATKSAVRDPQARMVADWRDDHARFVDQAILGPYNAAKGTAYRMSAQQLEASRALTGLVAAKERGEARDTLGVSIMAGKGVGKDSFAAWTILWFLSCFSFPKVPCVSVSADQLSKVLWSELAKWLMFSPLRAQFTLQNDKLFLNTLPDEARGKRWLAFPKAANPKETESEQVEGLAGIHEAHLLQIVDEGSGVRAPVFEALEGNMTGAVNIMLLIFNPTRSTGYAVESQQPGSRFIALRWNAEESELVERAVVEALERKYGRDSNTYRIRVLGLPPLVDAQTLIPWDWIEDAVAREVALPPGTPMVKGVDCGAGGDHSIICTRRGAQVFPLRRLRTADSQELERWIGTDIDADTPDVVRIDTVGIGWAIEGNVRAVKTGTTIEAADARREASESTRFFNKRAEMYWRLREAFERGALAIPDDLELKNGLGATKCEYVTLKGQSVVKIIDKKRIKAELGHSPDEADALALTFYHEDRSVSRVTRARRGPDPAPSGSPSAWMAS